MHIETCISTLNDRITHIAVDTFLQEGFSMLIIHQVTMEKDYSEFYATLQSKNIRLITLQGKGLSISRNTALENTTADWCWICDDDVLPEKGSHHAMVNSIQNHPHADILCFRIHTPEGNDYKHYPKNGHIFTRRSATRISSVEMLISGTFLQKHPIRFDTQFGLAATFPSGEEYIYITDALKQGARVEHAARYIAQHPAESSGKQFTEVQVMAKGAMFARVFGSKSRYYIWAFSFKKYKASDFSFWQFRKLMAEGRNKMLQHD